MNAPAEEPRARNMQSFRDDICAMGEKIEEILGLITEGFDRFRLEGPREAGREVESLYEEAERLTAELVRFSANLQEERKRGVRACLAAAHHLRMMGGCCGKLAEGVRAKIREGVLFSDKAFREIKDLYVEVGALLHSSILALRTGDGRAVREVEESGKRVEGMINSFSSEHEKRLISGVCAVRSSALFLDMLDAMRRIAGHAVTMVREASG